MDQPPRRPRPNLSPWLPWLPWLAAAVLLLVVALVGGAGQRSGARAAAPPALVPTATAPAQPTATAQPVPGADGAEALAKLKAKAAAGPLTEGEIQAVATLGAAAKLRQAKAEGSATTQEQLMAAGFLGAAEQLRAVGQPRLALTMARDARDKWPGPGDYAEAGTLVADLEAQLQPLPAPAPAIPPEVQQARAEAVDLLGAAGAERQAGNLGIAWELGRQAQAKWPEYAEANAFVAEVEAQKQAEERAAEDAARARRAALDVYLNQIIAQVTGYRTAQSDFDLWLDLLARDPSLWKDASSRRNLDDAVTRVVAAGDRLVGVSPVPADAEPIQAQLRLVASETRLMTADATRGRDASDARAVEVAKGRRERIRQALDRVASESERITAAVPRPAPPPRATPTKAPAPTPTPAPTARVGVPFAAGNWEYTVLESRRTKEIKGKYSSDTAKGEYVVVALRLKNIGRENFGLNAWDFELYDGAGIKYRSAPVYVGGWAQSLGYDGQIGSDTDQMPPGVPGTYVIAFDVAPGSQGLQLQLVQAKTSVPLS